jgi:hypothetical protein
MTKTKTKDERPRVDFKARSRRLLEQAYTLAEEMYKQALDLAQEKKADGRPVDMRSNDDRPGLASLQHCAQKAVDDIVRLSPLCGEDVENKLNSGTWTMQFERDPAGFTGGEKGEA